MPSSRERASEFRSTSKVISFQPTLRRPEAVHTLPCDLPVKRIYARPRDSADFLRTLFEIHRRRRIWIPAGHTVAVTVRVHLFRSHRLIGARAAADLHVAGIAAR